MASTNQTPNYGLPVYVGTDLADWMDTNTPFGLIDTAVKQASTDASNASSAVTTLSGTVSGHTTDITNLQGDVTSLQSQVNGAKTAVGTSYNNVSSGLTATNIQGAIDELNNALLIDPISIPYTDDTTLKTISNIDISKTGYTPIAFIFTATGSYGTTFIGSTITGNTMECYLNIPVPTSTSLNLKGVVVYAKV